MNIRHIVSRGNAEPVKRSYFHLNTWYINYNGAVWKLWDKFDRFGVNSNDYHRP